MMHKALSDYESVWVADFEFLGQYGCPVPICYCAKEIFSGRSIKKWLYGVEGVTRPEYSTGPESIFVAFSATAEMSCHLALHWQIPENIIDLLPEYRNLTNGLPNLPTRISKRGVVEDRTLIGVCTYHHITGGDLEHKTLMRDRILQGAPYSPDEQQQILDYCDSDVQLTAKLFNAMVGKIEPVLPYALFRGRYVAASAQMESWGIPLDLDTLTKLRQQWDNLKDRLIEQIDTEYHVFEGKVFKNEKFIRYLNDNKIPWDLTKTGKPRLDRDYFKDMVKLFPELSSLRELRHALNQMKLNDLEVCDDGRNRTWLTPFGAKTGRNTPSTSKFIFGNSVWIRSLIRPPEGSALCYIDYSQQEVAIAAALSNDDALKESYASGDTYLTFGKMSGMIPQDATKASHAKERSMFKTMFLATNYGQREESFSRRTGVPLYEAKEIYRKHRSLYHKYWTWIERFMAGGQLVGRVSTPFGWSMYSKGSKPGTLLNFPMQATGSDILRLAICLCIEHGIKVVAPVHDAILIEAPEERIEKDTKLAQELMTAASVYVINFPVRTDASLIHYPDRYADERGAQMWDTVMELLV